MRTTTCAQCRGRLYRDGWGTAWSSEAGREVPVHHGCAGPWFIAQAQHDARERAHRNGATTDG